MKDEGDDMVDREMTLLREADPAEPDRAALHLEHGGSSRIARAALDGAGPKSSSMASRWSVRRLSPAVPVLAGVLIAVAGVILLSSDQEDASLSRTGPLADIAVLAAGQPAPPGVALVEFEQDQRTKNSFDRNAEIWIDRNQRYERRIFSVDGARAGSDTTYINNELNRSCDPKGARRLDPSPEICVPLVEDDPGGNIVSPIGWPSSTELSEDPERLREQLTETIRGEFERGLTVDEPTLGSETRFLGVSGGDGPAQIPDSRLSEALFVRLTGLIADPLAGPRLRAAALELIGKLDRVSVTSSGAETEVTYAPDPNLFTGSQPGRFELFLDSRTSRANRLRVFRLPLPDPRPRPGADEPASDPKGKLFVVERLSEPVASAFPEEALRLRELAERTEDPEPPPTLPEAQAAPPVELTSGAGWRLEITSQRSLRMTSNDGRSAQASSDFTLPPTLLEARAYPTKANGPIAKVFAGPIPAEVEVVEIEDADSASRSAEIIDAFDLRWFWIELAEGERVAVITTLDGSGDVVARREGRRLVEP